TGQVINPITQSEMHMGEGTTHRNSTTTPTVQPHVVTPREAPITPAPSGTMPPPVVAAPPATTPPAVTTPSPIVAPVTPQPKPFEERLPGISSWLAKPFASDGRSAAEAFQMKPLEEEFKSAGTFVDGNGKTRTVLSMFDVNGDGKLTIEEITGRLKKM